MSQLTDQRIHLLLDAAFGSGLARQDAYRAMVSTSMDVAFDRCEADAFYGQADLLRLGEVGIGTLQAAPHTAFRSARTLKRVGVGLYYVDVFLQAGFNGEVRGMPITVSDGDCVAFGQKSTFRLDLGHFKCLFLVIPQAVLEERLHSTRWLDGAVLRAGTPQAQILRNALHSAVAAATAELEPAFAAALGLNLVDLVITCFGGSLRPGKPPAPRPAPKLRPHLLLLRIQRFVEARSSDPSLDPATLCARFDLSRSALYRLFEPLGGPDAFIVSCRAKAARRLLATPRDAILTVTEIARRTGFGNERALRRAMVRLYGHAPGALRVAADGLEADNPGAVVAGFFDEL